MRQRGRKSGAGLGILQVDGKPNRLDPPTSLSTAERAIFCDVVAACDRDHFRPSDLPLLVRYVEAAALGDQAAEQLRLGAVINGKPSPWITVQEKAVRAMVALSMRLRLSPQSRIDAKTLGRQEVRQGPAPWEYGNP
ncbi:MAG: P27 family phage terminase small subunit [Pseudolabrys sp.]